MKLVPTEHDAQVAYFDWVRAMRERDERYWHIYAIPNAGKRSKAAGRWYLAEGLMPGYPDINVDVPVRDDLGEVKRCGLRIEHKRKGAKLTDKQKQVLSRIKKCGFFEVAVCYSTDELVLTTLRYLASDEKITK